MSGANSNGAVPHKEGRGGAAGHDGHAVVRLPADQLEALAQSVAHAQRPRLIDAKEAAAMLGVPDTWILAEARAERIPYVPVGRYRRFDPDELVEWWRARARGPRRSDASRRAA